MSFGPFSKTHLYVCISSYVGGCLVTMGVLILLVYTTVYTVHLAVILICGLAILALIAKFNVHQHYL